MLHYIILRTSRVYAKQQQTTQNFTLLRAMSAMFTAIAI
jgi:hypothetical protein